MVSTTRKNRENREKTGIFCGPGKNRDFDIFDGKPGNSGSIHMIFLQPEFFTIFEVHFQT